MVKELVKTPRDGPVARGWLLLFKRDWRAVSVNRSMFSATVVLGLLTLMVKVAAMLRDIVVAKTFGAGDAMDCFVMAFTINTCLVNLLIYSINYSLLPTFIRVREIEGRVNAQRVLTNVITLGMGTFIGLALLLVFGSGPLLAVLGRGFSASKLHLTQMLLFIMLPGLVMSGITVTGSAVLNSEKRFVLAGITPILTPILTATLLLTWRNPDAASEAKHLAAFVCVGYICEFSVITTMLASRGYSLLPRWVRLDAATREVLAQCGWRIAAATLMAGIPLVEQAMAARLGGGNVSLLSYSIKLLGVITGIGGASLATVAFPHFSHAIAVCDWPTVRHMVNRWTKLIFLVSLPAIIGLIVFSKPLLTMFFEHGAFTHETTIRVSHLQIIYALQIPFYIVGCFYAVLACALNASYIMVWGNLISLALCFGLNFYLSRWIGVDGIAMTSVAVYFCSAAFLRVVIGWKFKHVFHAVPEQG